MEGRVSPAENNERSQTYLRDSLSGNECEQAVQCLALCASPCPGHNTPLMWRTVRMWATVHSLQLQALWHFLITFLNTMSNTVHTKWNELYFPVSAARFLLKILSVTQLCAKWPRLFLSQILEVPVTARDVEREHHTQLKRWKKNRGELNFKSPPRMHGARLIMLAEPPRRQDLLQNPTILLEMPPAHLKKSKEKKKSMKKSQRLEAIPNPYPLPGDSPASAADTPPAPSPVQTPETDWKPQTETDPLCQQHTPPTDLPPAKVSPLQRSTQSLSSTEQDTYL